MTLIPIDKGIPMPPRNGPPAHARYPWAHMQPGDSILVPGLAAAARTSAAAYGLNHGRKYAARRMGKGTRIWRVR